MGEINPHAIVGVWYVKATNAPFTHHLLTFHADGTMLQANPDAGDPITSDSVGMGAWKADGKTVQGKFVEVTADRLTHAFVSKGEIRFIVTVDGDRFTGTAEAIFYDQNEVLQRAPMTSALAGERITPTG